MLRNQQLLEVRSLLSLLYCLPFCAHILFFVQTVCESAQGDLRHAVNTLKFVSLGGGTATMYSQLVRKRGGKQLKQRSNNATIANACGKTDFFGYCRFPLVLMNCFFDLTFVSCSAMHAVGKLLRGKRNSTLQKQRSTTFTQRTNLLGTLQYDPEKVFWNCPFDASTTIAFLQHNCISGWCHRGWWFAKKQHCNIVLFIRPQVTISATLGI